MDPSADIEFRFSGTRRLYGAEKFAKIRQAHILVIGLGGVGSWVVEALARSAVGELTLVDFDDVCLSNTNRQLQALSENVGRMKTQVLEQRVAEINPDCRVNLIEDAFNEETQEAIFAADYDGVVDAIDSSLKKEMLAIQCRKNKVPLVICGSAGGRQDTQQIQIRDLAKVEGDPMLSIIRRNLRRQHGFPRAGEKFGVTAVYSGENPQFIDEQGELTSEKPLGAKVLDCNRGMGTSMMVTATFGLMAADQIIDRICRS